MKTEKSRFPNAFLFIIYGVLVIVGLWHHELWGDELHSWNIAKGSDGFYELFQNIRYEGHPPFWYVCLFIITRFTHALVALKILQATFVLATAWIIIFKSPFSTFQKVLILCGYYFAFEYAILSRNYMPAVFFASCIVAGDRLFKPFNALIYYVLLFLLSSVHLVGLILAASLHASRCYEAIRSGNKKLLPFAGFLVLVPSLYFIFPPHDSQLSIQFWMERWNPSQLYLMVTVVVKSFFPFPDMANPHWWNTNFFLDNDSLIFRILSFTFFIFLLIAIFYSVRKNRAALVILIVNLALTGLLSLVFPLNSYRYVGFVFVGYLFAVWIAITRESQVKIFVLHILLLLQIPAALFAYYADYTGKFSTGHRVVEALDSGVIPPGSFVATDYWTLNQLAAFIDSSFYTIELGKKASFLLWDTEMREALHYNYGEGLAELLEKNGRHPFYFFSMKDPEQAALWSAEVSSALVFFSGLSVERSGEIYLYRIEMAR